MKKLLFFLLLYPVLAYSQSDTAQIRKVLDYMHTDAFRKALKDTNEAMIKRRIKEFPRRKGPYSRNERSSLYIFMDTSSRFWSKDYYCTPVFYPNISIASYGDSLCVPRWEKKGLLLNYTPPNDGTNSKKIIVATCVLGNTRVAVRYFSGTGDVAEMYFGTSQCFSFYIAPDNAITLLVYSKIIYN